MAYKLSNYRHAVTSDLKRWHERIGHENLVTLALKTVTASDCPCIVAAHLVKELYGTSDALEAWMVTLKTWSESNQVEE